jgi:hypothetical protein
MLIEVAAGHVLVNGQQVQVARAVASLGGRLPTCTSGMVPLTHLQER